MIKTHFHLLFVVEPQYFVSTRNKYLTKNDFSKMWQKALRVDYEPVVDIRIVKSNINTIINNNADTFDTSEVYEDDFMRQAAEELERELNRGKDAFDEEIWREKNTDEFYHESNKWYNKPFRDEHIARCYAELQVPYGSDMQTVKKAWRKLMKKHHPDLFANDPERMERENDISQEIMKSYEDLEKYLTENF